MALSGGGDSTALLLTADAWARATGRSLLVLSVDHGLQAQSPAWTRACAEAAAALGWPFRALVWVGEKPAAGLPAAARAARHRLLAEAAWAAGARALLMGHTADDVAEARAMRAEGATTPEPREWAPSPAWPEGRGLFLLRPLLGVRRAALREWLAARGAAWIDDPANADLRYARPRARAALGGAPAAGAPPEADPEVEALAWACVGTPWGGLAIARDRLRSAPGAAARTFVAAACLCASGTARPPRGERLDRLVAALRGEAPATATLAGARIEADAGEARFLREAGEAARGGLAPLAAPIGRAIVWDGRFEVCADRAGLTVRALTGVAARLPADQRAALAAVPAKARGGLPAVTDAAGVVGCPVLGGLDGVTVRALAYERLLAACGAVAREPG